MKNSILLFTLIIISISTFGQKLQLGLRFNPQISWMNISNKDNKVFLQNDGARMGFAYGLMADVSFSENYSFSTGISHNIFKGRTLPSDPSPDTNIILYNYNSWNLQYIQIPMLLKMTTNDINGFVYYGKFGLTPHFKINSNIDGNAADNLSFFNLYLTVGGGTQYLIGGNTSLLAGLSFNNGLVNINKENEFNIKTAFLAIDLGVLF